LLIERYYSLDGALCRELLGKKLNSRLRKDLDEVAEKCGVSLKSCRRQFDNVKRVFKAVEDVTGDYADNIEKTFGVSKSLSEQYATLLFASSFRLEVSKRKSVSSLPFSAVRGVCLTLMRSDWVDQCGGPDGEPAPDREVLAAFRDLRALAERDKEHRAAACAHLKDKLSPRALAEVESGFRAFSRGVVATAAQGLGGGKELRDFLVNLAEKVVEPMRAGMGLDKAEAATLLAAYGDVVSEGVVPADANARSALERLMVTLIPCALAIY